MLCIARKIHPYCERFVKCRTKCLVSGKRLLIFAEIYATIQKIVFENRFLGILKSGDIWRVK